MLQNLLENAVKYSPPDTRITVHAEWRNDEVQVAVDDEGLGVPVADRGKIFDCFYRVQGQNDKLKPGLGLGLYICKGFVEAHHGRIWVEERESGGSSFIFAIPAEKTI